LHVLDSAALVPGAGSEVQPGEHDRSQLVPMTGLATHPPSVPLAGTTEAHLHAVMDADPVDSVTVLPGHAVMAAPPGQ